MSRIAQSGIATLALRSALHRQGYRFRKDYRLDLAAGARVRPDIAFTARRVAVFVDGCFWHACPEHGRSPAVSTIWRILSHRGFVTPQPHKRPKSSYRRFAAERHLVLEQPVHSVVVHDEQHQVHRLERGVDVADQRAIVALVLALDQARHIKPRGVERLQNVVARGRQKPRLGNIGVVGLGLGADQFGIEPLELAGALAHATLERRIGALQRLRGGDARGDVGERGHDAGARHRVAAHLDHEPALRKALQERLVGGGVA